MTNEEWLIARPKGCECMSLRKAEGCYNRCDDALYGPRNEPMWTAPQMAGLLAVSGAIVGLAITLIVFVIARPAPVTEAESVPYDRCTPVGAWNDPRCTRS